MKKIKTFIHTLDEPLEDKFIHLIDYEQEDFTVDQVLHIIDQYRLTHLQVKYNLIVNEDLYLFFVEF